MPERDASILVVDQRTLKSILITAILEDHNMEVYRKPNFMFGDAAPDCDQQLLIREGQWIFTIEKEKYYLSSSKRHFPLSFF